MTVVRLGFSKSSIFARSRRSHQHLAGVFKFIHFGERFQKDPFLVTVNAVLVCTEWLSAHPEEKGCVFKFIWLSVDLVRSIDLIPE